MSRIGKYEFDVKLDNNKLFYISEYYGMTNSDIYIAKLCGLQQIEYQNILLKNYNATLENEEIYFTKKEDAKNALSWVESMVIMNKLIV